MWRHLGRRFPMGGHAGGLPALISLSLVFLLSPAQANNASPGAPFLAQVTNDPPHLPEATPSVGPLRRGKNGQLELVDPTIEEGSGPRLCAKGTICVGKNQGYRSLSAALAVAHAGGVIEVAGGTYRETAKITTRHLTIRGVAGTPHFDCAGLRLSEDKSCLLLAADGIVLENIEISGAELTDALGANGACIRNEPSLSFTLRRVSCHGSQDGILSSGGTITIENSEFFDNGWTGQTHNVYFTGDCAVTVRGSIFRDARVGHEFKSRCQNTAISDSTFRSTKGSRNLDIPDGGDTIVYRSTLEKRPGAENHEIVGFAAESCSHPGDMLLKDVRIINSEPQADIRNYDRCIGHPIILEGVTIEGMPPKETGYIVRK